MICGRFETETESLRTPQLVLIPKSRSSGKKKRFELNGSIISYNLPELWPRQIQRSPHADIQWARETCFVGVNSEPPIPGGETACAGTFDGHGMVTLMLCRRTSSFFHRSPSCVLLIPNSLVAISEPYSILSSLVRKNNTFAMSLRSPRAIQLCFELR
jgi:hypothetical protein